MTSSPEKPRAQVRDELPPALSSMWRLCKLGYRHEPGMLLASFCLSLLAALPDALLALWFKLLGEGVLDHDEGEPGDAEGAQLARRESLENRRADQAGRSARLCQLDGVVETPRRAGPSVG